MKREDVILVIIGLLLLAGMLFTLFLGGNESRHGIGGYNDIHPEHYGIPSLLNQAA